MTIAICFHCGGIKRGSFLRCDDCGIEPQSEDDYAVSLALSDHYFNPDQLRTVGERIQGGAVVNLTSFSEEDRSKLLDAIRTPAIQKFLAIKRKHYVGS